MNDRLPALTPEGVVNDDARPPVPDVASGATENPGKTPDSTPDSENGKRARPRVTDSHIEEKMFRVRNQTPKRLKIEFRKGEHETLVFAPLAERDIPVKSIYVRDLKGLESRGLISHKELSRAEKINLEGIGGVIFAIAITYIVIGGNVVHDHPEWSIYVWGVIPLAGVVGIVVAILGSGLGWVNLQRVFQQVFTLFLVLVTGTGLIAATIYYFGSGQDLLRRDPSLALLGRSLQFIFIAVASLFPALLYFLFDRYRLGTLRKHFEQQIFRFDPNVKTLGDVYAKYGSQLDELYGPDSITARGRHIPGTRWPIWFCTVVICIGWILTLMPVGAGLEVSTAGDVLGFFLPKPSGITFGFLGAYYFAVFSASRRYTRGDLQPKAYSHIVARIFIVVIMAWVVETALGPRLSTFALIFLIGVLPETFWTVFNEVVRNQLLGPLIHSLREKDPLTNLEGIDPYDRARLAEEGVTNVESLAHHDLIDLILATRIPVPRLVDWLDQAILYLHMPDDCYPPTPGAEVRSEDPGGTPPDQKPPGNSLKPRQCFHTCGIRTATDFISAYEAAEGRGELQCLFRVLGQPGDCGNGGKTSRIQVLYDTLLDDEWLHCIRHWRQSTGVEEETIIVEG